MPNSWGTSIIYHVLVVRIFKFLENDIDDFQDKFKFIARQFTKDEEDLRKYQNFKKGIKDYQPKRNVDTIKIPQDLNKTFIYQNNRYDFEDENQNNNFNNFNDKNFIKNKENDDSPIKKYNTIKPKID